MKNLFPYKWSLSDGYPAQGVEYHGSKVFSCFASGGGSSMGYKLAGYDVIGFNEIDPKVAAAYQANHDPKYSFIEKIQDFKKRKDLPKELFDLDVLDGSPPCSSFSDIGNREKDWGKEKKFREGQKKQVLDTLFFDFIELADKLKPKIVIAENVKGMLKTKARKYVRQVLQQFEKIGYEVKHYLLDASYMGVPQARERVFFIAIRKDLINRLPGQQEAQLFSKFPKLDLNFNFPQIPFSEVKHNYTDRKLSPKILELYNEAKDGETDLRYASERQKGKRSFFAYKLLYDETIPNTITGDDTAIVYGQSRFRNFDELCECGSFPKDYNFVKNKPTYLIGMSVPPVMMAQISFQIYNQWLKKLNYHIV